MKYFLTWNQTESLTSCKVRVLVTWLTASSKCLLIIWLNLFTCGLPQVKHILGTELGSLWRFFFRSLCAVLSISEVPHVGYSSSLLQKSKLNFQRLCRTAALFSEMMKYIAFQYTSCQYNVLHLYTKLSVKIDLDLSTKKKIQFCTRIHCISMDMYRYASTVYKPKISWVSAWRHVNSAQCLYFLWTDPSEW